MTAHPTLAEAPRGGIVETAHRGAVAVVDAEGALHSAVGDIDSAGREAWPLNSPHENTR
jgi:L-asparaginase II